MHVRYAFAHVTNVVLDIACCVFDEFIRGVRHLLMMVPILFCAGSVRAPQAGLLIFKLTTSG